MDMAGFTALIPLDTTELSETAFQILPMLKTLGFDKARLVSVFDEDQKRSDGGASLQEYLNRQAARVAALGLEAETRAPAGKAAEAILAAAAEPDVDLVLVATHGRSGLARLRLGSVADQVIKNSPCPALVVGPNVDIDLATYSLKRILVPLDGDEAAELSLPVARYLARQTGAQIDLLRSVSVTAVAQDPTMGGVDLLGMMIDEAKEYLARIAATLEGFTTTATVVTGSAGEAILDHLKVNPVDLVIMASRGRTGLQRAAFGSVTERALQGPDPVLVFEPGEDRSRLFAAAREAAAS
jgi:nucleotide-binding universal stress UspA family protein